MVQDVYFKWLGMKRTGMRWVVALIKKLWDVSWDQWENRNEALDNTPIGADLSGTVTLNQYIIAEFQLGSGGLPVTVISTFTKDIMKLIRASSLEMKC